MALSGNGWPVSPSQAELGIETMVIGNASFPVRGGKVRQALEYVITQVHNRVEKANSTYGCWGYSYRMNVNSPGTWSNHASGTAVDFNATLHPNGVPTASTFSAAQIEEIHQILAEVGGVVRWGGDYSGTPDAMHFEIDVPPESLDVAIDENAIPVNGEIKPIGAPSLEDPAKIPRLTENSVSYPTMMNYGHGFAQWLYTPTQTGVVSIDALLSHFSDPKVEAENPLGPSLGLHIFEIAYDSTGIVPKFGTEQTAAAWPGDDLHPARLAGQMNASVKAGVTYVIRTTCIPSYPWIRAVVRIGSFAEVGPWITPDPIETITTMRANTSGGGVDSLHFPIILDSTQGGERWVYQMGHPGWFYTGLEAGPEFLGHYQIGKALFGDAPWVHGDAVACAWRWARRFHQGHGTDDRDTWSPDGTDTTGWNGTSVYDDYDWMNINGYGICPFRTDVEIGDWHGEAPYSYFLGRVGVRYRIDTPLDSGWDGYIASSEGALFEQFKFTSLEWQAYGGSYHVDFDRLRYSAGASGWGGAWRGPAFYGGSAAGYRPPYMPDELDNMPGAWVEWEGGEDGFGGDYAKILDAQWAVDEYYYTVSGAVQLPYAHNVSTVAEWYLQRVQPAEGVDGIMDSGGDTIPVGAHPYGMWGPWGDYSWYGQAPGDGPQAFRGSAEHVASTTGGTTPWQSIDPSYWSFANDRDLPEEAWEGDLSKRPVVPAQVRFAVLPRVLFSDALPFTPPLHHGQQESGDDLVMEDFLQGQAVAIKLVLQPTRYRINYAPQIPDITYAGGPSIDLGPEDTGQVLY